MWRVTSISFKFYKIKGMFMGTIFVLYPWKCNTRQITLGQALQTKFFFIESVAKKNKKNNENEN